MTTETMANIISVLAICISLASVALCIYGRVQDRRVAAAIAAARTRPPRTPPLMASRQVNGYQPVRNIVWIPVEALEPEIGARVLATIKWFGEEEPDAEVYEVTRTSVNNYGISGDVIAWARLPEPYKIPAGK